MRIHAKSLPWNLHCIPENVSILLPLKQETWRQQWYPGIGSW